MHSQLATNRRMALGVVLIQIALLGILIAYPNELIAIASIITFVLAAAIWRFGFIIKPILVRSTGVIEGFGKYEMPPAQDIIIKKEGDRYYASAYLLVRFTQSSTEKTPDQIALTRQSYERAISSLGFVCKISNMICPVDLSGFVERLKERRSRAETRISELSSLPPSPNQVSDIAMLRREIESYEKQLEKILEGERPMRVLNYAMTCASSRSKEDAVAKAAAQAAELKSLISSTLDTEVMRLGGDEMKRCFEWEYMLPGKEEADDFLY